MSCFVPILKEFLSGVDGCKPTLSVGRTKEIFQANPHFAGEKLQLKRDLPQIMYTLLIVPLGFEQSPNPYLLCLPAQSETPVPPLMGSYVTKCHLSEAFPPRPSQLPHSGTVIFFWTLVLCVYFDYSTHHTALAQFVFYVFSSLRVGIVSFYLYP